MKKCARCQSVMGRTTKGPWCKRCVVKALLVTSEVVIRPEPVRASSRP